MGGLNVILSVCPESNALIGRWGIESLLITDRVNVRSHLGTKPEQPRIHFMKAICASTKQGGPIITITVVPFEKALGLKISEDLS